SPLPFSTEKLSDSLAALDRVYLAKETVEEAVSRAAPGAPVDTLNEAGRDVHRLASSFAARLDEAMDDDFNSAAAIGYFFELVRAINRFGNDKKARARGAAALLPAAEAFRAVSEVFGVGAMSPAAYFDEAKVKRLRAQGKDPAEIDALVVARGAARAARDWSRADELRAELDAQGIAVMDSPEGSTWRVRVD
ncbi:MAG: cysteine--tRNA ligase, partial [Deltaproteobacteria bacterium]|nr:cysteine--tRNA ligase [Deltaproteobacteria bacterium]